MKNKKKMKTKTADNVAPSQEESAKTGVGFLDLSAELRNCIYDLCLTIPTEVIITPSTYHNSQWDDGWSFSADSTSFRARAEKHLLSPNLLASCKVIHNEATAILYGSNKFKLSKFYGHGGLPPWAETIGDSVKLLRIVHVEGAANKAVLCGVFKSLKSASALETLTVDSWCRNNLTMPHTMANGLYPLLLHLHRNRKSTDKKAALDVLELYWVDEPFATAVRDALKARLKC